MNIRIDHMLLIAEEPEETLLSGETAAEPSVVETSEVSEEFERMSRNMDRVMFIAPIIIVTVFVLFFFFVGRMIFSQGRRYKVRVKGTVVDKRPNARFGLNDDVEFEYMFRGMSYRSVTRWPVPRLRALFYLPIGREAMIHVNPDDPTDISWSRYLFDFSKREDEYGNRL